MPQASVAVLGAGAWGTTFANLLVKNGKVVTLWTHESSVKETIQTICQNRIYLPHVVLHPDLVVTDNLEEAVEGKDIILLAQPSRYFPSLIHALKPYVSPQWAITILTKGLIFSDQVQLLSSYVRDQLSFSEEKLFVLSGPNFAVEIAQDLPSCSVLAGTNEIRLKELQSFFTTPLFRVYANKDMIGVQMGGPLKNVIAIAAGILAGMNLGNNIHAALLTRGSQEMKRLLTAMGAKDETIFGLACLGDLILTCSSSQSRNFSAGLELAKGVSTEFLQQKSGKTIEGIDNLKALVSVANEHQVEVPICTMLHQIIFEGKEPRNAILELMNRHLKFE